jgi:hypothetical protein
VVAAGLLRRRVRAEAVEVPRGHRVVAEAVPVPAVAAVVVGVVPAVVAADGVEQETMNMNKSLKAVASGLRVALMGLAFVLSPVAWGQQAYASPDAAADALVDGIARHDWDAVKVVMGPDYRTYIPTGAVAEDDITNFLEAWAKAHKIVPAGADKAFLGAGVHGWTLPIPIVKTASGWHFDIKGAADEMRTRRIGRNELAAIQVALAYTDAQEEYFARVKQADGVKQFAQKGLSTPGKRDGLYWASLPGEQESPLGPDFADAKVGQPYHGYAYKILTAQGKDAPGGAKSYVQNGRMTGGYALIAWPAKYDDTGVMTFIVNRDGVVYQKDLGPGTDAAARAITAYNPDPTWTKVTPTK